MVVFRGGLVGRVLNTLVYMLHYIPGYHPLDLDILYFSLALKLLVWIKQFQNACSETYFDCLRCSLSHGGNSSYIHPRQFNPASQLDCRRLLVPLPDHRRVQRTSLPV